MGPRLKPNIDNILEGKTLIPSDASFIINIEKQSAEIKVADNVYSLGNELIYIVKHAEDE